MVPSLPAMIDHWRMAAWIPFWYKEAAVAPLYHPRNAASARRKSVSARVNTNFGEPRSRTVLGLGSEYFTKLAGMALAMLAGIPNWLATVVSVTLGAVYTTEMMCRRGSAVIFW